MSREEVLSLIGSFTWMFGFTYFIETAMGNFLYSSPNYDGDNTIRQYDGSYAEYSKKVGHHGRDKGKHIIKDFVDPEVEVL